MFVQLNVLRCSRNTTIQNVPFRAPSKDIDLQYCHSAKGCRESVSLIHAQKSWSIWEPSIANYTFDPWGVFQDSRYSNKYCTSRLPVPKRSSSLNFAQRGIAWHNVTSKIIQGCDPSTHCADFSLRCEISTGHCKVSGTQLYRARAYRCDDGYTLFPPPLSLVDISGAPRSGRHFSVKGRGIVRLRVLEEE